MNYLTRIFYCFKPYRSCMLAIKWMVVGLLIAVTVCSPWQTAAQTHETDVANDVSFASSVVLGQPNRHHSGDVGMKITMGSKPVLVTKLGRSFIQGNSRIHTLKIRKTDDNTVFASVEIDMAAGEPDTMGFKYATLDEPFLLEPDSSYYITTSELFGGDMWYGKLFWVSDDTLSNIKTDLDVKIEAVRHNSKTDSWAMEGVNGINGGVNFMYRYCSEIPVISGQPQMQTAIPGKKAKFNISASVPDGGKLACQWQSSSDCIDWKDIAGAGGSGYTTGALKVGDDSKYFRCIVSNNKDPKYPVRKISNRALLLIETPGHQRPTVTVSAGSNGTVVPSGNLTLAHGGSKVFTLIPDMGFEVAEALIDGTVAEMVDNTIKLENVMNNHTINVTFRNIPITLDIGAVGEVFDGIGGLSAGAGSRLLIDYKEPYKSQIMDMLFKPGFGASLNHFKIEIGGDINSTFGTEPSPMRTEEEYRKAVEVIINGSTDPKLNAEVEAMFKRGYEFWLASEAKKRNPDILLDGLQWGAPGWIENIYSQKNVDYLIMFIKGARKYWGVDFDLIGGMQNECNNANPEYIKLLRKTLDASGLGNVKISVVDYAWNPDNFIIELKNDPELVKAVYSYGTHYAVYMLVPEVFLPDAQFARDNGLKIWNGEDNAANGFEQPKTKGLYLFAMANAHIFNRSFVTHGTTMSQYCFEACAWLRTLDSVFNDCSPVNATYPWSGYYDIAPTCWAMAHTTQFAIPGQQYLSVESGGSGSLPDGGYYVTIVDPVTGDYSLVIETYNTTETQTAMFRLKGLKTDVKNVWVSYGNDDSTWFIKNNGYLDSVFDGGAGFTLTIAPNSIVTVTSTDRGYKGGFADIPDKQFFPSVYEDSFEDYNIGATSRYLSDLFGAFEVVMDDDAKHNKCIEQQIAWRTLSWGFGDYDNYYPMTVIGDYDYAKECRFSVDAKIPSSASADEFIEIGGFNSAGFQLNYGPRLRVRKNGEWFVYDHKVHINHTPAEDPLKTLVAKGAIPDFDGSVWHTYRFEIDNERVTVYVDGAKLSEAASSHTLRGVYMGSGWNKIRFDNLSIDVHTK